MLAPSTNRRVSTPSLPPSLARANLSWKYPQLPRARSCRESIRECVVLIRWWWHADPRGSLPDDYRNIPIAGCADKLPCCDRW